MAMRIDITFARPLSREDEVSLLLALAALPKTRCLQMSKERYQAKVIGEALGLERIRSALTSEKLAYESIQTSLHEDDDRLVDELSAEGAEGLERLRPIGRSHSG